MNETDADRFELLDRVKTRIPDLDLDAQSIEWTTLADGHEALLVNGGGLDEAARLALDSSPAMDFERELAWT